MINELADLEHSLDLANKATFHGLPGASKAEALVTASRLRNKLDALDSSIITAFEATQEHAAEGHSSVIGWLQHHRREHGDDAARRKRLAKRLRVMPVADQAMVDGEITAHHVDVLHRAWRMVGEEAFAIGEQALVDAAVVKRFSDFVRLVEYFIYAVGPTEAADREQKQYEERYGSSSRTLDGCGKVDSWMTPIPFTVWQAELERLMEVLYQQDRAEAQERLGRRPLASELARTTRQRRVDAMVLMAERSAAFDDPEGPGPSRFVLNLHSDADLLAKILEVIRDGIEDPDLDLDEALEQIELTPESLHELDDGTVITVNTIVLAILTGTIRGYLYDPDGVPLRYGRERRLFTKPQADALRARFRRCCHPYGCDRTGPTLQSNHTPEWQRGGQTDIDQADTQCGRHNRWYTNTYGQPPPPGPIDTDQRRTPPDTGPPT